MHSFTALILGALEGMTEFLPVSSTAHLVLASHMLGVDITSDSVKIFEIAVQMGAVAAIPIYYHKQLFQKKTILTLLAAFIPTAIIGLIMKEFSLLLLESLFVIAWALIIGGCVLIAIEWYILRYPHKKVREISLGIASIIGAAQALAFIPGTSRSGATIAAGLLMGIPRATIAEFSFLLSVPTLGAATALALVKASSLTLVPGFATTLAVGMSAAFCMALLIIHVFMKLIKRYTFVPFGLYRIALGVCILFFFV
jgi:undecaprenyl-diphosphatase